MWKRKSRILDRQFQLKTAFSVIAIALIAYLVVIASAVIITNYNNRAIRSDIQVLNKSIEGTSVGPEFSVSIKNLKKNIDRNFLLVSVIIAVVLLQVVILYFFLIRLTHRISGPIYVISRHIEDIISGKEPELRGLRDKDELQEFYEKFAEMIRKVDFSNSEDPEE
jgi:sensor histidine kinase YesM